MAARLQQKRDPKEYMLPCKCKKYGGPAGFRTHDFYRLNVKTDLYIIEKPRFYGVLFWVHSSCVWRRIIA
jgi:hypothetical protein